MMRGDDFEEVRLIVSVRNGDGTFTPLDFTGCSGKMHVKKDKDSPPSLSFSTPGTMTLLGDTITLKERTAKAMDIPGYTYYYDLEIRTPEGKNKTYFIGTFPIIEDWTKWSTS